MAHAAIDKAVEAGVTSKFFFGGSVCTCNDRMYLDRSIYDRFREVHRQGEGAQGRRGTQDNRPIMRAVNELHLGEIYSESSVRRESPRLPHRLS